LLDIVQLIILSFPRVSMIVSQELKIIHLEKIAEIMKEPRVYIKFSDKLPEAAGRFAV
jgi:hypothetical protein